jgi:serine/threonine-protein kinase
VWAALHKRLDELVAIKFMDGELAQSDDARLRFEREAKAAAKIRSPHVVQILDYGVDDDTPFIVMELLEGEDLKSRLKKRGRLSLGEAREILIHACKALRLAADAGIVHRDLKPGNIFLAKSGDDEVVKILDFGVAKAIRRTIGPNTSSGMLLGSPHYMSPEQARAGATLDHRGDLWSMAVILFQMITGRKPFTGEELGDVIVKICTEPAPSVRALVPQLPEALDHFFVRALAKDPNARFQSARSLASEFAAIVARHDGIPAAPLSASGEHLQPDFASGSFPGDSKPGSVGFGSGSFPTGSVRITEATPAPQSKGSTLTVATRSVPSPAPKNRSKLIAAAAAAGVVMVVGIVALSSFGGDEVSDSPAAAATQEPETPAAAERAALGGDGDVDTNATESSAEAEEAADPEPEASASAAPEPKVAASPAPRAPIRRSAPRKATTKPAPKPTAKPKNPVLGF